MRCVTKHLVQQPLIKKQCVLLGCRCAARQNWSVLHGVSPRGSSAAVPGAAGSPPASAAVLPHKWSKEGRGDGTGPSQHSCAEGAYWLIHHLTPLTRGAHCSCSCPAAGTTALRPSCSCCSGSCSTRSFLSSPHCRSADSGCWLSSPSESPPAVCSSTSGAFFLFLC